MRALPEPLGRWPFKLLLYGLLLAAWWHLLAPSSLGGPLTPVVISGSSMEPTFSSGDLVLVRTADSYRPEEVIAFRTDRGVVIHRLVELEGDVLVTAGDSLRTRDPWLPTVDDVVGRSWITIPGFAGLLTTVADPMVLGAICGAAAGLLMLLLPDGRQRPAVPLRRQLAGIDGYAMTFEPALPLVALAAIQATLLLAAIMVLGHASSLGITVAQVFLDVVPASEVTTYVVEA